MAGAETDKKLAKGPAFNGILNHTKEVKGTVTDMLGKVQTGLSTYSELLDGFSVLTGQLNTLSKTVANEKGKDVQSSVVQPTAMSAEYDKELEAITEGRLKSMDPEQVPQYLRTKLDLEIENEHKRLQELADKKSVEDIQNQIAVHNDIIDGLTKYAYNYTENMEDEEFVKQRTQSDDKAASSNQVTRKLLMVQNKGKAEHGIIGYHK